MLKDNHIDAAGGIPAAVAALRAKLGHMVKLEVETRSLAEVREALEAGADVIMLDNMDCPTMAEAVKLAAGRALLKRAAASPTRPSAPWRRPEWTSSPSARSPIRSRRWISR